MDPVVFEFGPFAVRWYGILISSAIAAGAFAAYRECEHQGIDPDHILNLSIIGVPAAIIGARLYYVLFSGSLGDYLRNPVEILATWHGGLAIHGGLIGGILAGFFYLRKADYYIGLDSLIPPNIISPVHKPSQDIREATIRQTEQKRYPRVLSLTGTNDLSQTIQLRLQFILRRLTR
jgi:phosphatidylglycerol:prolipoprotein diacylglycerol transferase